MPTISASLSETYKSLRCDHGYSQAKAMERMIMFGKDDPKTRELIIKKTLKAEKSLKRCKK